MFNALVHQPSKTATKLIYQKTCQLFRWSNLNHLLERWKSWWKRLAVLWICWRKGQ